ncbi:MAG TPA: PD-(D/E)XK nuclease family protein [Ignavibacteria bacterium]
MISFLEKLADEVLKKGKENLSGVCVVFPSRRAGIYFRNVLSKKLDSPIWSPAVLSIEDFFSKYSDFTISDKLLLIFELYKLYNQEESFDKFYSWGEMVLKDFDEVDKYLVTAESLFKKAKDYKEIEEAFPVEMQEEFKRFRDSILDGKSTDMKSEFIKIWEMMGEIYSKFRESLKEQGIAYEGMAHRDTCERFLKGDINIEWEKIFFAGFNSLNKCEESIIDKLIKDGKAEIFWDCDEYFINDTKQEAGYFIRKNIENLKIKNPHWIDNNLCTDRKNLRITGIPLNTGQVKLTGSIIKELAERKDFSPEKTAIVISEESLLLPVLYSLPDTVKELNVTMGFMFKNTPLYNLLQLLKSLQNNLKNKNGKVKFYHKDIKGILLHPYIKLIAPDFTYNLYRLIKDKNYVYIPAGIIAGDNAPDILKVIFEDAGDINGIFKYLRLITEIVSANFEKIETFYDKFQLEYIYTFFLQLNRFDDILKKYQTSITEKTFWKILVDILGNVSIPFTGEPLKGLQIMGLLETRAIDFENVIILSMNEGILPGGKVQNSFIPYPLRKAFKMPVYQDNDAITGYYLYRLLQRAKNIHLLYNTESENSRGGISRYLLQIEYELSKVNKELSFSHKIASTEADFIRKKEIKINKTKDIIAALKGMKSFSATSILDYISCSLKFYFKRIAGLKEEEDVLEVLDSAALGNILHKVMEILYLPYVNKTINENDLVEIQNNLNNNYEEIFQRGLESMEKENIEITIQGRNVLIQKIIKKLAGRIIVNDKENVPFKIEALEANIKSSLKINDELEVNLNGKIDRIEIKDNILRIIDYKTSNCELKKINARNRDVYFDKLISNLQYKESFQAIFYSYLFQKNRKDAKVNPGLYIVKDSKKMLGFIKDDFLQSDEIDDFEKQLLTIFSGLFDKEQDFHQTDDEKNCTYCDFKSMCYRNN